MPIGKQVIQHHHMKEAVFHFGKRLQKFQMLIVKNTVTSENIAEDTVRKICDWTNIYGKLESGEYDFSLTVEGFYIRIKFTVNENGEISNVTSDFM